MNKTTNLPTVSVELTGTNPDGYRICIMPDHPTMVAGKREDHYSNPVTLRRAIASARDAGITGLTLIYTRTMRRGTVRRRVQVAR